ncbi:MAG: T9SS type A sorting domain-containing protein [Chitinophagaceae bacterium]
MKKIYFIGICFFSVLFSAAQNQVNISAGTDLYIAAGTEFSSEGLSIIPTAGFALNGVILSKNGLIIHPSSNPYIARVYHFSTNTAPFSGTIRLYYSDTELNGLDEATLKVNIHTGSTWQNVPSTTNDAINNFVVSNTFSNKVFNEITLASALSPLPLTWGAVTAYRKGAVVFVEWETLAERSVSHFEIEKSLDGIHWKTIRNNIASSTIQIYKHTDDAYQPDRLYYRIKQVDEDGKFTYSAVVFVNEVIEKSSLKVTPNPFEHEFKIENIGHDLIKSVQIYNSNGALLKKWDRPLPTYDVKALPAGMYTLKITLTNGGQHHLHLQKR